MRPARCKPSKQLFSNAPIALAIHSAAKEPTGEPYDTVSFGRALGTAVGGLAGEGILQACASPPMHSVPPARLASRRKRLRDMRASFMAVTSRSPIVPPLGPGDKSDA